jgi:hypothetical protein
MILDYPLENLGPERFQYLCQALVAKEFPKVQCFPVGQPDGGRDAISLYTDDQGDKFVVFQVKFSRNPLKETDPHKWLVAIMEEELAKVKRLTLQGASHYLLLTNIPGTAHPGTGSIDLLDKIMSDLLNIPSQCWWRNDINRRLDDAWSLKWIYPELMTGPDFLRWIAETGLSEHKDRRSSTVRAFLRSQYQMDEEVRFKQVELQNKLLDLFVDVPLRFRDQIDDSKQIHTLYSQLNRNPGAIEVSVHEEAFNPGWVHTPKAVPIARQDAPSDLIRAITVGLVTFRGLPNFLPLARAFRRPARTRSTMRLRSSSATAPSTVKIILPVGVEVSTCSESETNSMSRARKFSKAFRRCETERAKRSKRHTTMASKYRRWASCKSLSSSGRFSLPPEIPTSTYSRIISHSRRWQYSRSSRNCISGSWPL